MLPSTLDIPDSAFYCVECGPTNVGLGCDLPGHGEFALLADLPEPGADERGVRECFRCPEYVVRCVHVDGDERMVWIADDCKWESTPCTHSHASSGVPYVVVFGQPLSRSEFGVDRCPHPAFAEVCHARTREEADEAFERFERVMLGREVE